MRGSILELLLRGERSDCIILRSALLIITTVLFFYASFTTQAYASSDLSEIETYLNSLHNITADFVQTDPQGRQQMGKFFLSRPGKMRWQYETPKKLLLIINDKSLIHVDQQLDQVSYFKNNEEFLSLLTQKHIKFSGSDIKAEKLTHSKNQSTLTISKKGYNGSIHLLFTRPVIALLGLEMTDELNKKIAIKFTNLKTPASLDPLLFTFKNKIINKSHN